MNWKGILIHHSAGHDTLGLDTQSIRRWHVDDLGWRDIGYHFLVELVGRRHEVICGRFLNREGAHASGHNRTHLGVCLVGDFSRQAPPEDQLTMAAQLTAALCANLSLTEVLPHSAVSPGRNCPGHTFPWQRFFSAVRAAAPGIPLRDRR